MISATQPLPSGNAIRLWIDPPPGASSWRILRRGADSFAGADDDNALLAYEGADQVVVDTQSLRNDQATFYKPFYRIGGEWVAGASVVESASARFEDASTDVVNVLRDRLLAGMQAAVEAQRLVANSGAIAVYTAPPVDNENTRFPLVSVHLDDEGAEEFAVGDNLGMDGIGDDPFEGEGYLSNVVCTIVGWCTNPDQRIAMRKELRSLLLVNREVFSAHGMEQIKVSLRDVDELESYDAPMFQAVATFTCTAPARVRYEPSGPIISRTTVGGI